MTNNVFMKHPKKTLFVLAVIIFVIIVFGFEKYIAWKDPALKRDERYGANTRHILLRENPPLSIRYIRATDKELKRTDSLTDKAYRLEIDEDGFVSPSRIHEKPDVKIVFLGGSTTECMYVDEQNRFPYLVGRLLENEHRKVNSYNSGVGGNNTFHSINILINKIIPLNPDIVVMMENVNDLIILLYEGDYWNKNPYKGPIGYCAEQTFSSHIRGIFGTAVRSFAPNLYPKITAALRKSEDEFAYVRGKKIVITQEYLLGKYKTNLQTFINICRANGIAPVLMTQASRFKEKPDKVVTAHTSAMERDFGITYSELKNLFDKFNETVRDVGEANKVLVIDLAKKVPQEKNYIYDFDHYNDNGSRFVAKIIAGELVKNNLLKSNEGI
ncbi:MAG: SGNH/GDSL hydrolase family protein [Nitrospirae bacterium]|nr:SGNH/GDSL hydrolase family protein [Nitrospirota bacterium]